MLLQLLMMLMLMMATDVLVRRKLWLMLLVVRGMLLVRMRHRMLRRHMEIVMVVRLM